MMMTILRINKMVDIIITTVYNFVYFKVIEEQ